MFFVARRKPSRRKRLFCCLSPALMRVFFRPKTMTPSKNSYRLAREAYALISSERESPIIEKLRAWVSEQENPFTLADAAECLNLRAELGKRSVQSRIGIALKELGCERFELKTPNARHWYARPPEKIISGKEK
jgi:hypothetical protein